MKYLPFLVLSMGIMLVTCNTTNTQGGLVEETEAPAAVLCSVPFSRGMNFSGWFEAFSAEGIMFTNYTEEDFANAKSLGADIIRLPIRMHSMTLGPPDYTLDPLFLRFLDTAVNWAEKYEIYIIIDNHSFDPSADTDEDIDKILLPVWARTAEHYKDRSNFVLYEILNEPHGISDERWGAIQGMAIETIRKIDQKHTIVVGGAGWNSIDNLSAIPEYNDTNLIYTFHFYDPGMFTHQGAAWAGELFGYLAGVPFPADRKRMPKLHPKLRGTWVESSLQNEYKKEAAASTLYKTLDKAVAFSQERNVPVFCGEFGVFIPQSPPDDRITWYKFVTNALDNRNIPRTSWDYYGGFGIYNNPGPGKGDFFSDLNVGVVSAMGFTPPPQQPPRQKEQIKSGFVIYDDYPARGFTLGYWGDGEFSIYDTSAAEGEFAIRWGGAARYDAFWILFDNISDLNYLAEAGYRLEFQAKTERPVHFDVRFLNPESAESIPWRKRYAINENVLPPDGRWHIIRIPLADMQEHGAWVNAKQEWLNPRGEFSWEQIKQIEFIGEDNDLKDSRIWLDSIKIVGP